jgi:hypothetical protein
MISFRYFSGGTEEKTKNFGPGSKWPGRDSNQTSPKRKYGDNAGIDFITAVTMGDVTVGRNQSDRERPWPYVQACNLVYVALSV